MTTPDSVKRPTLTFVGRGSFGEVSFLPNQSIAIKTVLNRDEGHVLESEWHHITSIYEKCDPGAFFSVPRPLALFVPSPNAIQNGGEKDVDGGRLHEVTFPALRPPLEYQHRNGIRKRTNATSPSLFRNNGVSAASYAMKFISSVPSLVGDYVHNHFYPDSQSPLFPPPCLLRLHLGKDGPERVYSRFINTQDFPINLTQYEILHREFPDLVASSEEVAKGMGQILGRIHWVYGCDARDIEFVIGQNGDGDVEYFVLDFNQVRAFDVDKDKIDILVDAHFANDPYIPLAKDENPLFTAFCQGYRKEVLSLTDSIRARADEFLHSCVTTQNTREVTS